MAKDDGTTTKTTPAKLATPVKSAEPSGAAKEASVKASAPVAAAPAAAVPEDEAKPARVSTCVVNDGQGQHVGDAVNGKVCSYHAMHYDRNGNRR